MFKLIINTASSRVQAEENEIENSASQYIELSEEDTGFQYTSLLFRFEDLEMTRSFNISIPATPHNNAVLGFSEYPAATGDAVTDEMGCTLLYDTGQINGNISVVDYADGAYNACLTLSGGVSALRTLAEATDLKTALGSSVEEEEADDEGEGTGTVYTVADPYSLSIPMDWDESSDCRSDTTCAEKAPDLCIQSYYTEGAGGGTFFDVCCGKSGFVAVGPTSIVSSADGKHWTEIYTTGREETVEASTSGFYACAAYDGTRESTTYYVRKSNAIYSFEGIESIKSLTLFVSGVQTPSIDNAGKGYQSGHAFAPLCVMGDNLYYASGSEVYYKSCTENNSTSSGSKLGGSASGTETYSMAANGSYVYGVGRHGSGWYISNSNISSSGSATGGSLMSDKNGWFVSYEGGQWFAGTAGKSGNGTRLYYDNNNNNNNNNPPKFTAVNEKNDKTLSYPMFCGGYWNNYYIAAGESGHSYYAKKADVSDVKKWTEVSIGSNTWWAMAVKNDDDDEQVAVLVGANGIKYLSLETSDTPDTWNSASLTLSSLPGDMPFMPCVSYMYLLESISAQLDLGWTAEADEYYDTVGKWLVIVLPTALDSGGNKLQQGDTFNLMDNLPDVEPLDLFLTYGAITGRTLGLKNNARGVPCLHFFNYNWADEDNYNDGEVAVNPVYYGREQLGSARLTRGVGELAYNNFIRFTEGEMTEERGDGYETSYSVPNSTLTAENDWYTSPLASGSTLGSSLYLKNIEYTREVDEDEDTISYTNISWEGDATLAVWKGCSSPLGTLRAFDMGQNEDLNRVLQEKTTYEVTIPMPFYQFMQLNNLSLVSTSARVWCVSEAAWQGGLADLTLVRLNAQNYDGTGVGGASLTVSPTYISWTPPEAELEACVTVQSSRGVTYSTSNSYLQVERCGGSDGEDTKPCCDDNEDNEVDGTRYKITYTEPGSDEEDSSDTTATPGTYFVYFQSGNKTVRVTVIISIESEDEDEDEDEDDDEDENEGGNGNEGDGEDKDEDEDDDDDDDDDEGGDGDGDGNETEIPCAYAWMECTEQEPDDMPSWATCNNE